MLSVLVFWISLVNCHSQTSSFDMEIHPCIFFEEKEEKRLKSSPFSQANPESYLVTIDFQFNFYLSLKHGLIYYIFCWVNKTILQLSDSLSIPNLHLIPFFPSRRFVDAYFSFWCPHKKWLWIYVSFGSCVKRRCTSCATLTI
jgi:hypothetical protein